MDYFKEYKSFINSYYLSEGLRVTVGVALPALICSYFNLLPVGIILSLGAMCASTSDSPGPIHHRLNGMLACTGIIVVVCLLTGYTAPYPLALGFLIAVLCFIFCMIGVYGARAISIGVAALLIMVLNIDRQVHGWQVLINAAYVGIGGIWYTILSVTLYHVRPYKLIQQALGDCIIATANYMQIRSEFYDKKTTVVTVYNELMDAQVQVQQKQSLLRELLYKNRAALKDATTTSRTLMIIFIDVVDLFEKSATSFSPYESLHQFFGSMDILHHFKKTLFTISENLYEIGIAVQSGNTSPEPIALQKQLMELQDYFIVFRNKHINPKNLEGLITLRKILQAVEDMVNRINTLQHYTKYDKRKAAAFNPAKNYDAFITHTAIDWKLLRDSLSMQSDIFRHALRVTFAAMAGYIISHLFVLGHSYWILLTIIVILKPTYSLTQKRNYQRLIGTICGALAGLLILYFISDKTVLFICMIFLMVGTYSFIRINYLVCVLFMTPYILLLFHLLNGGEFKSIIYDRLIDTGIGSAIAFAANFLLIPVWEHEQIKKYMTASINTITAYYKNIAMHFTNTTISELEYKLSRKEAFVAVANLSDAFSRMLDEPKWKQKNSSAIHQFVVLNHTLTSHIATLAYFSTTLATKYQSVHFNNIIAQTTNNLTQAATMLDQQKMNPINDENIASIELDAQVKQLLQKRNTELENNIIESETKIHLLELKPIVDQFIFIANIAADIRKLCETKFII